MSDAYADEPEISREVPDVDGAKLVTNVGVGPWQGPWPTLDGGVPDPRFDPELLQNGDRRNVEDRFRYWKHEQIVAELDRSRHGFHVAVENWEHDFNIGSVIRTANAFNAKAFHIVGRRRWNRRGAMVTDRYQHEFHHPSVDDLMSWAATAGSGEPPSDTPDVEPGGDLGHSSGLLKVGSSRMPVFAIDNVAGSVPIETFDLPRECVFLFGQEGPGCSPEALEKADAVLDIAQFGSTRSINAGAAAAITMHAWIRRHVFDQHV